MTQSLLTRFLVKQSSEQRLQRDVEAVVTLATLHKSPPKTIVVALEQKEQNKWQKEQKEQKVKTEPAIKKSKVMRRVDDEDDDQDQQVQEDDDDGFVVTEEDIAASAADDNSDYIIALWSFEDDDSFICHWFHYDELRQFTCQQSDSNVSLATARTLMTHAVNATYPWHTTTEMIQMHKAHMQKKNVFGLPFKWQDCWTLAYHSLYSWRSTPVAKDQKTLRRRRHRMLEQNGRALWPLASANNKQYLVHLVFDNDDTEYYDMIRVGFYVFHADLDYEVFTDAYCESKMTAQLAAQYPWRTGDEGVEMIRANIGRGDLRYNELLPKSVAATKSRLLPTSPPQPAAPPPTPVKAKKLGCKKRGPACLEDDSDDEFA